MASIPSVLSSSFLKRIVTPNSVVITSRPPCSFFPNMPTKPLPLPVALSTARDPPAEIPSVPVTEPPSFPKEMPVGPNRDPSETDPGVPPEIIVDPPPTNPVPNNPNPMPKPEGPKPPLSPPGPDIPMPPRPPDVAPPRPPGPEIVPPPSTPPDISPPPTPEGPQIIV
ncbi:vegetative cell wall protein gp1-like [Neltuma alba]|uniref:vegetative cell wall protein gp1-like n=1 Tax=Neltuma alba TaxID=207710 RepID=UPI0010A3D829|nr:vegetative cell wall protein gp1-like [Prosopis alba]